MGNLKKWPMLNFLKPDVLRSIRLAFRYGEDDRDILIATHDHEIFTFSYDSVMFEPQLIESGHKLFIKTMACQPTETNIYILTFNAEIYQLCIYKNRTDMVNVTYLFSNILVKDIVCGRYHIMALTFSGEVYHAKICDNMLQNISKLDIGLDTRIVSMCCGNFFNAVVTENGKVHLWSYETKNMTIIEERTTIKKVVCGYLHYLALSDEGDIYTWGSNSHGQLGNGTNLKASKPVKVQQIANVLDIAASMHMSVAMGEGNRIFIWGLCLEQHINVPTLINLSSIHDAFACYRTVMHQPLVNNCQLNMLHSLGNAFNDKTTKDLTIILHGKSIHVHKSILIFRCQYFRKKFLEDPADKDQCVTINEMFSYKVYEAFLKYLYTDKINLSPEDSFELLQLADYYSMKKLKTCCMQSIYENIEVKNVLAVYTLAINYDIKDLEDFCFKFISRNMTAVVQTPYFVEIDGSLSKQLIIKAAQSNIFCT